MTAPQTSIQPDPTRPPGPTLADHVRQRQADIEATQERLQAEVDQLVTEQIEQPEAPAPEDFAVLAEIATMTAVAALVGGAALWMADHLTLALGRVFTARDLSPERYVDPDRLRRALGAMARDVLSVPADERTAAVESLRTKVVRLTANEALDAGSHALTDSMKRRPQVKGWRRKTDPSPCELCTSLAGTVVNKSAKMIRHPNCTCVQAPVIRGVNER